MVGPQHQIEESLSLIAQPPQNEVEASLIFSPVVHPSEPYPVDPKQVSRLSFDAIATPPLPEQERALNEPEGTVKS